MGKEADGRTDRRTDKTRHDKTHPTYSGWDRGARGGVCRIIAGKD